MESFISYLCQFFVTQSDEDLTQELDLLRNQSDIYYMSEKKKTINPALVFTLVALFSFATGLALGLLSPSWNKTNTMETISQQISSNFQDEDNSDHLNPDEEDNPNTPLSQQDSMDRYRKMLEKSFESETQDLRQAQLYGISIGSYSSVSQASEVSVDLKKRYSNWDISVYNLSQTYNVVVGSFTNQKEAEDFLKTLPQTSLFLKARVIRIPERQN